VTAALLVVALVGVGIVARARARGHPLRLRATLQGLREPATLIGLAGGGAAGISIAGPLAGLPAGAILGALAARGHRRRREAATAAGATMAVRDGLADACDLLACAIDGGAPLPVALAAVARHTDGAVAAVLKAAIAAAARPDGPSLGQALRRASGGVRPLAALLAQAEELGTPLADALRLLARDERERRRLDIRERAARLAPRLMLVVGGVLAPAALLLVVGAEVLAVVDALGGATA